MYTYLIYTHVVTYRFFNMCKLLMQCVQKKGVLSLVNAFVNLCTIQFDPIETHLEAKENNVRCQFDKVVRCPRMAAWLAAHLKSDTKDQEQTQLCQRTMGDMLLEGSPSAVSFSRDQPPLSLASHADNPF